MTDVPISADDPITQITASAAQTTFSFPFIVREAADLVVLRTVSGVTSTLVLNTDYTIAADQLNVDGGGDLVLTASSFPSGATAGDIFTLYRMTTIQRLADFARRGSFKSSAINTELDIIFTILLELARDRDRSIRFRPEDAALIADGLLTDVSLRKGKLLGFDSSSGALAYFGSTINDSVNLVTATGGNTARTHADRWGDIVNVKDHGAVGDDSTDDITAIQAAVTRLTTLGRGLLYFPPGIYRYSGAVNLPSNAVVDGDQAVLKTTSSSATFGYALDVNPTQTLLTANALAGATQVALPTGKGADFSEGDTIIFESDAIVMGTDGRAREAHQIRNISGDNVDLDGPLEWSYNTADNAKYERQNDVGADNITVRNLKFTASDGGTAEVRTLQFNDVRNLRIENVTIEEAGGGLGIKECQNVQIHNLVVDHLPNFDDSFGYGIWVAGAANMVSISNFICRDTRHGFTTLADNRGGVQYGGPRNVTVNMHGRASRVSRSGTKPLAIIDTHSYGRGIEFLACTAEQGSDDAACVQVRCEKVKFIGGMFRGGFRTVDLQSTCDEVELHHATIIDGGSQNCLNINGQSGGRPALINDCTIGGSATRQVDVTGPGAIIKNSYLYNQDTEDIIRDSNSDVLEIINNDLVQGSGGQVFQGLDANARVLGNRLKGIANIVTNVQFGANDGSLWADNWYDDIPQNGGVANFTSGNTLRRHMSGMIITNTGASGTITHTLWPAQVGDRISVRRNDATDLLRLNPDGTETIGTGGAGKYLQIDTDGTRIDLHCVIAGEWDILPQDGAVLATDFSYEP